MTVHQANLEPFDDLLPIELEAWCRHGSWTALQALCVLHGKNPRLAVDDVLEMQTHFPQAYSLLAQSISHKTFGRKVDTPDGPQWVDTPEHWLNWAKGKLPSLDPRISSLICPKREPHVRDFPGWLSMEEWTDHEIACLMADVDPRSVSPAEGPRHVDTENLYKYALTMVRRTEAAELPRSETQPFKCRPEDAIAWVRRITLALPFAVPYFWKSEADAINEKQEFDLEERRQDIERQLHELDSANHRGIPSEIESQKRQRAALLAEMAAVEADLLALDERCAGGADDGIDSTSARMHPITSQRRDWIASRVTALYGERMTLPRGARKKLSAEALNDRALFPSLHSFDRAWRKCPYSVDVRTPD